jgi:hypothetical protein
MTIAAKAAMAARPIIIALPLLLLLLRPQPLNRVQDPMPGRRGQRITVL